MRVNRDSIRDVVVGMHMRVAVPAIAECFSLVDVSRFEMTGGKLRVSVR